MSIPTTRQLFKEFCLRQLGAPVNFINLHDDQIEDCIDLALQFFWDYHYDGADKYYYKIQVTDEIKTNGYVEMPENIIGVVNIFDISTSLTSPGMWNVQYQIVMSDMFFWGGVNLLPYYMSMQNLDFIQQMLVGKQPIRYNRHHNRLYIDMDWSRVNVGHYLIAEAYQVVHPDDFPNVWKDRWLIRYCTALMKRLYGTNTKKFTGLKTPGHVEINGKAIYDEAVQEIDQLERDMIRTLQYPPMDMIG